MKTFQFLGSCQYPAKYPRKRRNAKILKSHIKVPGMHPNTNTRNSDSRFRREKMQNK
jgi:hypothetical protein